jgi:acyl dehydratase
MYKIFYEDISVGDSQNFGGYKVTKQEIIEFATKYDPQPFHLDEEAAKNSVFGGLCASGWHTCAMLMRMLVDHLQDKAVASLGSPGIDGIKWIRPVMVGDTLHVETNVTAKRESKSRPNLGLLKGTYIVTNQKGEKVMTMQTNYMVAKRPT